MFPVSPAAIEATRTSAIAAQEATAELAETIRTLTVTAGGPHIIHEVGIGDESEHENSEQCICRPVRLSDDDFGNQRWQHHPR